MAWPPSWCRSGRRNSTPSARAGCWTGSRPSGAAPCAGLCGAVLWPTGGLSGRHPHCAPVHDTAMLQLSDSHSPRPEPLTWTQVYTPIAGSVGLSALAAALPVAVLLGLLAFAHFRAHWAALAGLGASLAVAVLVFGMPPALAGAAALNGAAYGLFPIGWIVLCAIFVYDVTVQSGDFEVVKHTVAGLASDRRLQALLIAFSFGAFIEGAAGFGTPVAISAAMLIGLGFRPLQAAGMALIGNTAPVAFGALGTPLIALAAVTGLPLEQLSAMVGRILPVFSVIVPFWLVWAMAGRKNMLEVWPACLTAGVSFGVTQCLVSNLHGPWVVDIAGALVSMLALVVLLTFWQPRSTWSFEHETEAGRMAEAAVRPVIGAA